MALDNVAFDSRRVAADELQRHTRFLSQRWKRFVTLHIGDESVLFQMTHPAGTAAAIRIPVHTNARCAYPARLRYEHSGSHKNDDGVAP